MLRAVRMRLVSTEEVAGYGSWFWVEKVRCAHRPLIQRVAGRAARVKFRITLYETYQI